MAIVQISKIQQRRGKKYTGTGLPQLATGELAWCVDSQELFIGNGAVSEGSPAVGNTKILSTNDFSAGSGLLTSFAYSFRSTDSTIQTGPSANNPVERPIAARIDDIIISTDFGVIGDGITDNTIALQRAIDQLFLNPAGPAYSDVSARGTLNIPAGVYVISSTIFIPSYASLKGEGIEKTIISHSGSTPVFRFVNDLSTPGNPAGMGNALIDSNGDNNFTNDPTDVQYNNQPRFISISNMSISTSSNNQVVLQLEAVRNSSFSNIKIAGNWNNIVNYNSIGISLLAFTELVTCEDNNFNNITITGFTYAVYASGDIKNNIFEVGFINDVMQAFVFGMNADGVSVGQKYGPRDTKINNYKFYNVKQQAVLCGICDGTILNEISMVNVGNDGAGVNQPIYPQIYFSNFGNTIKSFNTDRTSVALASSIVPYIPAVSGRCNVATLSTDVISIGHTTVYLPLVRLPVSVSVDGVATGTISHSISYFYNSVLNFSRAGTILITVDVDSAHTQLSDEYNYAGAGAQDDGMDLDFQITLLNKLNEVCTGGDVPYTISLNYANTLTSDAGYFHYTYTSIL